MRLQGLALDAEIDLVAQAARSAVDKSSVQGLVRERFRYTVGLQMPHNKKGTVAVLPSGCGEKVLPRHQASFPAGIGVLRGRAGRDTDLHDIAGRESLEDPFSYAKLREMVGRAFLNLLT